SRPPRRPRKGGAASCWRATGRRRTPGWAETTEDAAPTSGVRMRDSTGTPSKSTSKLPSARRSRLTAVPSASLSTEGRSAGSKPESKTLSAIARYMAPVSREGRARRRATVLLPTPEGPSMATTIGSVGIRGGLLSRCQAFAGGHCLPRCQPLGGFDGGSGGRTFGAGRALPGRAAELLHLPLGQL